MDRASQVLAQGVPPGVPTSYLLRNAYAERLVMADACRRRARRYCTLFDVPSSSCYPHCAIFIVLSLLRRRYMSWVLW
jgi:hypothetical protein